MKAFFVTASVILNLLLLAGLLAGQIAFDRAEPIAATVSEASSTLPSTTPSGNPAPTSQALPSAVPQQKKPRNDLKVLFTQNRERLTSQFDLFRSTRPRVVFLGDSLTEASRWGELLPDSGAINRGIGGDTVANILKRLDQIVAMQPGKIFVMIGINDLLKNVDPAVIADNYRTLFDSFDCQLPDTKIYLQSVLPVYGHLAQANNAEVHKLNAVLISEAEARGYHYVDLHSTFSDGEGKLQQRYSNDGLHLLSVGYARWRDEIRDLVYE